MGRILIDFHASSDDKKAQFIQSSSVTDYVTLCVDSSELVQLTEQQRKRLICSRASKAVVNWAYGLCAGGRIRAGGEGTVFPVSKMVGSSLLKKADYPGEHRWEVVDLPAVWGLIESILLNYPSATVENDFREVFTPDVLTSDEFIMRDEVDYYSPSGLPHVEVIFTTRDLIHEITEHVAWGRHDEPGVLVLTRDQYERGYELTQEKLDNLRAIVVFK